MEKKESKCVDCINRLVTTEKISKGVSTLGKQKKWFCCYSGTRELPTGVTDNKEIVPTVMECDKHVKELI